MSPVDLLMLPLIVERLQAEHPDCALQVRSMKDEGSGASVVITVDDLANRSAEVFTGEVEALRGEVATLQNRLHVEEKLKLAFEAKYQAVTEFFRPMLEMAIAKQIVHVHHPTGLMLIGDTMSGDTFNVSGQAGAVGPNAHAHDNTFQQVQGGGIDLPKLAEELGRLRDAMKGETTGTREQDKAIGAVADAEEAAAKGDGKTALRYLKGAGTWALGVAEKIGVNIATEALKRAL